MTAPILAIGWSALQHNRYVFSYAQAYSVKFVRVVCMHDVAKFLNNDLD